jgi:hypothetical protein
MTSPQTLKAGTRIELKGTPALGGFSAVAPQRATVCRWTSISGPIRNHINPTSGGWHVVKFDNGESRLLCHETRFRVIDNRA